MAFEKVGVRASIEGMRRFERDAERFNRRIAGMGRTTRKLGGPLGMVRGALGKMGGALSNVAQIAGGIIVANVFGKIANAISGAATAAVNFTKDSIMLAARVEELDVVLKLLGTRAGFTEDELDGMVESIRELGITTDVAQGLLIQFSRWGLKMADATKLARVAQDAAVISFQDSSEALAGLMHGITTMNTRVLRTYGITLSGVVDKQKEYAAELGISFDAMTSAQKIQAVLNAVLEQGETIAGAYEAAMGTAGKQLRSMKRHVKELMISVGTPFLKAFANVIETTTDWLKTLRTATEEGGPFGRVVEKIAEITGGVLSRGLEKFGKILESVVHFMGTFFGMIDEGLGPLGALRAAIAFEFPPNVARTIREYIIFFEKLAKFGPIIKRILLGPFALFLDIIRLIGRAIKALVLGEFKIEDILPPFALKAWEHFLEIIEQFRGWWDRNGPTIQAQADRIFGTIAETVEALAARIIPWVVDQLEKVSDWFDLHEDDITGAIKTIADFFEFTLGPAVTRLWDNVLGPFLGDVVDLLLEVGGLLLKTFGGDREKFFDVGLGVVSLGPRKPTDMQKFFEDLDVILTDFLFTKFPEHFRNFRDIVLDFFGLPNWESVVDSWQGVWGLLELIVQVAIENIRFIIDGIRLLMLDFVGDIETLIMAIKFDPLALMKLIGGEFGPGKLTPQPGLSIPQGTLIESMIAPTGATQTSNFNLTVNTSAPSEPIIADFRMLAALGGRP